MRTPFFYGEYELAIDDKNRISVPAEIRRAIIPDQDGEAFFVSVGRNRAPWFYPEQYYRELVGLEIQPEMTPSEDQLAYIQMKFALARKVEWDKQGRMQLPAELLKRTGLGREVTLIGMKDHLELWNRSEWEARREVLSAQGPDIEIRVKQSRSNELGLSRP